MKAPSGIVTATMAAKKNRIWIQPLAVKMSPSELLGREQRVDEVREKRQGQHEADDVLEVHGVLRSARRRGRKARRARKMLR